MLLIRGAEIVVSTWEVMRKQLAAGLNYSLCGIPYWNTDLGGFFAWKYNNNVNNIAYHELHVRWYQWGVFQPLCAHTILVR